MVATDFSLRHCGLPALDLWQAVLPNHKVLCVHEDNQAMIRIIETGKNPTMRYLHRTHRISVAWLHEVFGGKDLELVYEVSSKMAADIFTKAFTEKTSWRAVCALINHIDKDELTTIFKEIAEKEKQSHPQLSGGTGRTRGEENCEEATLSIKSGGHVPTGRNKKYRPASPGGDSAGGRVSTGKIIKPGERFFLPIKEHNEILALLQSKNWPKQSRRSP